MRVNNETMELINSNKKIKKLFKGNKGKDSKHKMQLKSKKFPKVFIILIVLNILLFVANIAFGTVYISFIDACKALFGIGDETKIIIIRELRLPRAVVAVFVGFTLSISGAIIKAVMKNPLADTGLLGIQSGATVVALFIILVAPGLYFLLPVGAFLGGLAAYLILMALSYRNGFKPLRVILSGVAVNAFFGSLIGLIQIFNSESIGSALSWLNGSLAQGITFTDMYIMICYGTVSIIIAMLLIPKCNLLLLDDSTISNLGFNVDMIRFVVATASVFIASISVSIVGVIGFVGLICPHIARLLVGNNYKQLLPTSMFLGSALILFADVTQRILFSPIEIPVGIVISFIGAPFFLYLMRKEA